MGAGAQGGGGDGESEFTGTGGGELIGAGDVGGVEAFLTRSSTSIRTVAFLPVRSSGKGPAGDQGRGQRIDGTDGDGGAGEGQIGRGDQRIGDGDGCGIELHERFVFGIDRPDGDGVIAAARSGSVMLKPWNLEPSVAVRSGRATLAVTGDQDGGEIVDLIANLNRGRA